MASKEIEEGKACAALAYLFPIGLIWYLADEKMKKNKFVAYHVYQGLVAAIAVTVVYVAGMVLSLILIGSIVIIAAWILCLVWFIQGLINSLGGQEKPLWLIGGLAKNFNF